MTTLALYTYGVYMEHIGKAKTKFYSSSANIYSSLVYKRKGTFMYFMYFSFILPSTQPKRKKKKKSPNRPTVTLSELIFISFFAEFTNKVTNLFGILHKDDKNLTTNGFSQ